MTKRTNFLIAFIRTLFMSTFIIALLFTMSCDDNGDDPPPELYEISGVYTFKKATLQTTLTIPGFPFPIPAGTIITDQLSNGLLAEAPCDDKSNGAIELKSNNELFFTCIGESNEAKGGTWAVNSDTTELSLNLASPPLPGPLQLKLEGLEIDESNDVMGGSVSNFPINKALLGGFLPESQRDPILAGIDDNFVILVDIDIEFQKVTQ